MNTKVEYSEIPRVFIWEQLLLSLELREPIHFRNEGNVAANCRAAIKRYYAKARLQKCPDRRFSTCKDKATQTFSVIRTK